MSHGETHPCGVWDIVRFLLQLHHSLTFHTSLDSLHDLLGFVASGLLSSCSQVLLSGPREGLQWSPEASAPALLLPSPSPVLILRLAFYPLEEGGANLHNMVLHPIVWNLGPPVRVHCAAQNVWEVQVVESSTTEGLHNLAPKGLHRWC